MGLLFKYLEGNKRKWLHIYCIILLFIFIIPIHSLLSSANKSNFKGIKENLFFDNLSDIIDADGATDNINYATATASSINTTSDGIRVWTITVRDGGGTNDADALPTILDGLTIIKSAGNSVSSWTNTIKQAALFDGATKVAEVSVTSESIVFTSINTTGLSIADGSTKNLDLYLTFETTNITDNQQYQFEISNATVTGSSSDFAASNAGGAISLITGDKNRIEVTASKLVFSGTPASAAVNTNFSAIVNALDNNDNLDLDASFNVNLAKSPFTGTLSASSGLSKPLTAGVVNWNDLQININGNYFINGSGPGVSAGTFNVQIDAPGTMVSAPSLNFCANGENRSLGEILIQEGVDSDFSSGSNQTLQLTVPVGFQFDNTASPIVTAQGGGFDISSLSISFLSTSTIQVTYSIDGTPDFKDEIHINGLKIISTTGSAISNAKILRTGGSAIQNGNSVANNQSHGSLSIAGGSVFLSSSDVDNNICDGDEVTFTAFGAASYDFFIDGLLQSPNAKNTFPGWPNGNIFKTTGILNGQTVSVKSAGSCPVNGLQTYTYSVVTIADPVITSPSGTSPIQTTTSADPIDLIGSPNSPGTGTFSGNGVEQSGSTFKFYPMAAGAGSSSIITYTYSENGCAKTTSITIDVTDIGGVDAFPGLNASYCEVENTSIAFGWKYQAGKPPLSYKMDSMTGPGVQGSLNPLYTGGVNSGYTFNPYLSSRAINGGPGPKKVTCYYHVKKGVKNSGQFTYSLDIQVFLTPVVSLSTDDVNRPLKKYYCKAESPIGFIGSPSGTGPGIAIKLIESATSTTHVLPGGFFDPGSNVYPAGDYILRYEYEDPYTLCDGARDYNVRLVDKPLPPSGSDITVHYCAGQKIPDLEATPTFPNEIIWYDNTDKQIGLGPSYPSGIDNSVASTTYFKFSQSNLRADCESDKKQYIVVVDPLPVVTFSGLNTDYCIDASPANLSPTPSSGGLFKGKGIWGNKFYPDSAGVGQHKISFSYTNASGCTDSLVRDVNVNPLPNVSFSGLDTLYCLNAGFAQLKGFPDGGIFSGPGISSNQFFPNVAGAGTHKIIYTFTDGNSCTQKDTQTVVVRPVPVVNFTFTPTCAIDTISFTDLTSVTSPDIIEKWQWDFGDQVSDTIPTPKHKYLKGGNYNIKLTVTTKYGCSETATKSIFIGTVPRVNFTWNKVCFGEITTFNNLSFLEIGDIKKVTWSFGDGTYDTLPNPTHRYLSVGTYNVTLKIITNTSCTDSLTKRLSIFPYVTNFPYFEDFKNGTSGWVASGTNSSWKCSIPNGRKIKTAASAPNSWITLKDSTYSNKENSWVESPCFNLNALLKPMISLKTWSSTDIGFDGAVLQGTGDDGQSWIVVGDIDEGINWYNTKPIEGKPGEQEIGQLGWSGNTDTIWKTSKYSLSELKQQLLDNGISAASVRFRVAFGSNTGNRPTEIFDGFAFDDVYIGERSSIVLVEHFANLFNQTSIAEANGINDLVKTDSREIISIQYHTDFPKTDAINVVNPGDPSARALYYGVSQVPMTVIDGFFRTNTFSTEGRKVYKERILQDSVFNIEVSFPSSPENLLNVSATITSAKEFKENLTVQLAVVERKFDISGNRFYNVLRKMLPDAAGTHFTKTWAVGSQEIITLSWLPENIDLSEIAVIVFVQGDSSKEIYQTSYTVPQNPPVLVSGINDGPIDNESILLFPVPADKETNISFSKNVKENMNWTLFNDLGRELTKGNIKKGELVFTLNTGALTDGMYLIKIDRKNGDSLTKKLIIHHE